jgi:hypothetical protein
MFTTKALRHEGKNFVALCFGGKMRFLLRYSIFQNSKPSNFNFDTLCDCLIRHCGHLIRNGIGQGEFSSAIAHISRDFFDD